MWANGRWDPSSEDEVAKREQIIVINKKILSKYALVIKVVDCKCTSSSLRTLSINNLLRTKISTLLIMFKVHKCRLLYVLIKDCKSVFCNC